MKFSFQFLAILVFSIVLFSACEKSAVPCSQQGSFQFTLNGRLFTGVSFNNTILRPPLATPYKRLDIRAKDATGAELTISVFDYTTATTPGCMMLGSSNYIQQDDIQTATDNSFSFVYMGPTGLMDPTSFPAIKGTFNITACDASNHTISGTFTFEGEDQNGNIMIGTAGSFTNMCWVGVD